MRTLFALLVLLPAVTRADRVLSVEELRRRFIVTGEFFVTDGEGKRLLFKGEEWRSWETRAKDGTIENHWSSDTEFGLVAIHHRWKIGDDGSIRAHIEQYGKVERGDSGKHEPRFVQLLEERDFVIENMSPIVWISKVPSQPARRVVIRFSPGLRDEQSPKSLAELPLTATDMMISDNEGHLWASRVKVQAKYAGFVTHRGAVYLSFFPFPGSSAIGKVEGRTIELDAGKNRWITLTSAEPFLPAGVPATVHARIDTSRKTHRLDSVHTMGSSSPEVFGKHMEEK